MSKLNDWTRIQSAVPAAVVKWKKKRYIRTSKIAWWVVFRINGARSSRHVECCIKSEWRRRKTRREREAVGIRRPKNHSHENSRTPVPSILPSLFPPFCWDCGVLIRRALSISWKLSDGKVEKSRPEYEISFRVHSEAGHHVKRGNHSFFIIFLVLFPNSLPWMHC